MALEIKQGLFKFDFTDYHAVLGVPIDASIDEISKRYRFYLARRLHPDSNAKKSDAEKKMATELFSKLVSPAYTKLSHDREKAEYGVLLGMMGKRLIQEQNKVELQSEVAKQLAKSGGDLDTAYRNAVNELGKNQYDSLTEVPHIIGEISELNLVYLLRKVGKTARPSAPPPPPPPSAVGAAAAKSPAPVSSHAQQSLMDDYCRRAEELINLNDLVRAKVELQAALKINPNSSRTHGLMGMVYLKQNQPKVAKPHIDKALALNPQEPIALEAKRKLDPQAAHPAKPAAGAKATPPPKATGGGKGAPPPKSGQKPDDKSGGGGLFGGLFGGGKKK